MININLLSPKSSITRANGWISLSFIFGSGLQSQWASITITKNAPAGYSIRRVKGVDLFVSN